ncbi:MAG: hypothetical protein QOC66_2721, partial [Pseudonocardiales bacterium]|nr:hypothetical protein [Pseudonocardiales bacterium]
QIQFGAERPLPAGARLRRHVLRRRPDCKQAVRRHPRPHGRAVSGDVRAELSPPYPHAGWFQVLLPAGHAGGRSLTPAGGAPRTISASPTSSALPGWFEHSRLAIATMAMSTILALSEQSNGSHTLHHECLECVRTRRLRADRTARCSGAGRILDASSICWGDDAPRTPALA